MSRIFNALRMLVTEPSSFIDNILELYGGWIPDGIYLRLRFRVKMGYWPNLNTPKTFNEKINWLKLHNRKPVYTTMVDKYAVKSYVASRIGEEYIIPTLGVWDSVDAIEWDSLPNQFVLKTAHGGGGGGVVICKDKDSFDRKKAVTILQNSMNNDIYKTYREWPYKNVPRRIIAEQYMENKSCPGDLVDYKFFCFNGNVKFFKIDFDRFIDHHANYYSPDGVLLEFGENIYKPVYDHVEVMPENLSNMISLAEKLSTGIPFLRVDLYNLHGKIYFGELTFYPAGGMGSFTDLIWDYKIGNLLEL